MTNAGSDRDEPNVLLILADQLSAEVLGCYDGQVPTPNIDLLAEAGVRFTDAVCPTPACSPSRASLITGRFPHSHGIVHNVNRRDYPWYRSPPTEAGIKSSDVTLGSLYYRAGYSTHHYGKWHLMDDDLSYYPDMFREHHRYAQDMASRFRAVRRRPREEWVDWYGWALPVDVNEEYRAIVDDTTCDWSGSRESLKKMGRLEFDPHETFDFRVADQTINRLESVEEPFFVTASFNIPHDPNAAPSPYYDQFDPSGLDLPDNYSVVEDRFNDDWSHEYVAAVGEPGVREFLRVYHAMVAFLDDQVGRLLDALDERNLADRTVVVFAADHGDMVGGHGMIWKSTSAFYDEMIRVPLVINGPDFETREVHAATSLTDVLPTLLDLTGHGDRIPRGTDGRSLAPLIEGSDGPADFLEYALVERIAPNPEHTRRAFPGPDEFAIRGAGWKYVSYADGYELLYNLDDDPGEVRNLTGDPGLEDVRTEMAAALEARLEETGYEG